MAVFLLCGEVGSGKTHALIEFIREEAKKGRKCYTNVSTLKIDKLAEQIGRHADIELVPQDVFRDPLSWPVMEPDHTVVQEGKFAYGSAVFIDECQFFLGSELSAIPISVPRFIDMHRHMTDSFGTPIDIFITSQYRTSLHKEIKRRVNTTYQYQNLEDNGAKGWSQVAKYRSADSYKKNFENSRKYLRDKTVYELYDSTVSGLGSVKNAAASNVKFIRKMIILALVLVLGGAALIAGGIFFVVHKMTHSSFVPGAASKSGSGAPFSTVPVPQSSGGASCSGGFYSANSRFYFASNDGSLTDVSDQVSQGLGECRLQRGSCGFSIRGTCGPAGLVKRAGGSGPGSSRGG